jgi:hypothetical protein
LADNEFAFTGDERGVADLDIFDVCYGVVAAGSAIEGDTKIAGARFLSGRGEGEGEQERG